MLLTKTEKLMTTKQFRFLVSGCLLYDGLLYCGLLNMDR